MDFSIMLASKMLMPVKETLALVPNFERNQQGTECE
jgi:hypothetical protein